MNPEIVIQSEVKSERKKQILYINTDIWYLEKNSTEEPVFREETGHPFLAIDWSKISPGFLLDAMKTQMLCYEVQMDFLVIPILILHYYLKNTYGMCWYDCFALKRTKVLPKYHFNFFLIYGRRIDKLKA